MQAVHIRQGAAILETDGFKSGATLQTIYITQGAPTADFQVLDPAQSLQTIEVCRGVVIVFQGFAID